MLQQPDLALGLLQLGILRGRRAGPDAVLDVRLTQPVAQARLGDPESAASFAIGASPLRATATTSSRNVNVGRK